MAQQRYYNFEENDSTDFLNRSLLGIIPYGLYAGFDVTALANNLILELNHTITGITEVDVVGIRTPKLGIVRTQQGVVIKEDAPITIGIVANTLGNPRIDTIIVQHLYEDEIQGGSQAIYKVVPGIKAVNPVPANLPYPEMQMVIGYLFVPGGMVALDEPGVAYTRVNTPTLGNDTKILRQNVEQSDIVRKQLLSVYGKAQTATVTSATKTLNLIAEGNYFTLRRSTDDYIEVDSIAAPFSADTYVADVLSFQRLKLRSRSVSGSKTGNIYVHQTGQPFDPEHNGDVYIEPGETVRLIDRRSFDGSSTPFYFILKGGEVTRAGLNKLNGELAFNRGTVSAAGGELNIDGLGNYYRLELVGDADISFLPQRAPERLGNDKQGGMIFLSVMVAPNPGDPNTVPKVTLIHDMPSPPYGTLPIKTPANDDFALFNGDVLILIEEENNWILASIIGQHSDVRTLTSRFEAYLTSNNTAVANLNAALGTHIAAYTAEVESLSGRINNILVGALAESRQFIAENLPEDAVILRGVKVVTTSGTMDGTGTVEISAGIATLNGDILTVPPYSGNYPIYLQRSAPGVGVWRTAPTAPFLTGVNYIRFSPYTSQNLADVIKRGANAEKDLRMSLTYNTNLFDTSGKGRFSEYGFALTNGQNGTDDMTGMYPVGFNPNAYTEAQSSNQGIEYRTLKAVFGEKKHVLDVDEMPGHTHTILEDGLHKHNIPLSDNEDDGPNPGKGNGGPLRNGTMDDGGLHTHGMDSTGGSQAHENRPPSRVTMFLQRIYVAPAGWMTGTESGG